MLNTPQTVVTVLQEYLAAHKVNFVVNAADIFARKGWAWFDRDNVTADAISGNHFVTLLGTGCSV